jgi:putative transposase
VLAQLTKRLLESALEGEITDHLGYDKHDPAGRRTGNSRNGMRTKTVLTDVGPVKRRHHVRSRSGGLDARLASSASSRRRCDAVTC